MNSPSDSRMNYEFTIFSRIHLKSNIFFANSLSFSRIQYFFREFTICFANFPWIHNLHHDFSLNSPSFSRKHYLFRELSMNSLSASRFTMNTLSFSRIHLESTFFPRNHYEFTFFFANLLWIHCFLGFTCFANSLPFPRI